MRELSARGRQAIDDLAQREGFSAAAVLSMLEAVTRGGGTMAQFSHPEFGGAGQWMIGGMIMISDMFNDDLKRRIDRLGQVLSRVLADEGNFVAGVSERSEDRNGARHDDARLGQHQPSGLPSAAIAGASVSSASAGVRGWWPAELGQPSSTGAQNDVRYAYFAYARRLVIDVSGKVAVYDTLDHQIGGVSQQQPSGDSLTFASQYGPVDVASLPIVSLDGVPQPRTRAMADPLPPQPDADKGKPVTGRSEIFATVEKLAELRANGLLTEEEFERRKTELLNRL